MNSPGTVRRAATARERARAELTREIKEEARRQLLATGADGLSLRAVAKELGMVSSALYRYYPSRDDLLTALIVDAYNALGAAAEHALAGPAPARERWIAACHAIRDWARSNRHEYALVYGSPVPGYRAPDATIGPASRVPLAFAGVVRDALAAGELAAPREALPVTGALAGQAAALSAALAASAASPESPDAYAGVPPDALVRAVIAWTQLFGMISFELFGQFVGSFEPADALFAYTVAQLTAFVGLREASASTGSGTPGTPAATLEA
jgi:AcrR family transcriptional regulator